MTVLTVPMTADPINPSGHILYITYFSYTNNTSCTAVDPVHPQWRNSCLVQFSFIALLGFPHLAHIWSAMTKLLRKPGTHAPVFLVCTNIYLLFITGTPDKQIVLFFILSTKSFLPFPLEPCKIQKTQNTL